MPEFDKKGDTKGTIPIQKINTNNWKEKRELENWKQFRPHILPGRLDAKVVLSRKKTRCSKGSFQRTAGERKVNRYFARRGLGAA